MGRKNLFVLLAALLVGAVLAQPARAEEKSAPAMSGGAVTGLSSVTLLVADQDKALQWYTEKLGFEKKVDQQFGPGQRWLTVVPKGQASPEIVLQKAAKGQEGQVGKSLDWVFVSDDCRKAYENLKAKGVNFVKTPDVQPYGVMAVFEDLYGNKFTLVSTH
jgi:predicted enzyme related to lactoylglutathione lyase